MLFCLNKEVTPEGSGACSEKCFLLNKLHPLSAFLLPEPRDFASPPPSRSGHKTEPRRKGTKTRKREVGPGQKCDLHPQPLPSHSGDCLCRAVKSLSGGSQNLEQGEAQRNWKPVWPRPSPPWAWLPSWAPWPGSQGGLVHPAPSLYWIRHRCPGPQESFVEKGRSPVLSRPPRPTHRSPPSSSGPWRSNGRDMVYTQHRQCLKRKRKKKGKVV